MSKNTKGKEDNWTMALGLYPGLLFGVRTYEGPVWSQVVFYIPFIKFKKIIVFDSDVV